MDTTRDSESAAEFGARMLDVMSYGLLSILMSIGHRARIFDALSQLDWATSTEIAAAAGLDERYMREWLSAMACGRVVDFDTATSRFKLPAHRAQFLTRAAGPANLAAYTPMVGFLAPVEDDIIRCFREGGGLGYEAYPKFAKAMAIQSRVFVDTAFLDGILPLVPGLRDRLSEGIDVCDVGCGAGHALNVMAREFPNSRFVGWDLLSDSVDLARAEAAEWGLTNVTFEQRDVSAVDEPFDLVTSIVAVHDHPRPRELLASICSSLRPDGVYLCIDSHSSSELSDNLDDPLAAWRYSVSTLHCMSVSLAYGGEGLGDCWGPPLATDMMREAGFSAVEVVTPDWLDAFHVYLARR